jgi:hypothetical protein
VSAPFAKLRVTPVVVVVAVDDDAVVVVVAAAVDDVIVAEWSFADVEVVVVVAGTMR